MKPNLRYLLSIIFLIALICFTACKQRNKLKIDEANLTQQIIEEENQLKKEKQRREKRAKKIADSIAKLPKDFRFREERGINTNLPPKIIDIAGNRNNPQKIKLSELYKNVKYIRLETLPDTAEYDLSLRYVITANHIYVVTKIGSIYQYDKEGKFVSTVCKGNLQYTKAENGSYTINREQHSMFEGAKNVYWNGQHLCYQYLNNPQKKNYLVTFDDKSDNGQSFQIPQLVESEEYFKGRGNVFFEIKSSSGILSRHYPYILNSHTMASVTLNKRFEKSNLLSVMSLKGDTICDFKDFDPIKNYSKSTMRGVDGGNSYFINETLYLRQAFNDTIYQLIPPNRMVAKYVFDYGQFGIPSAQKGVDPGVGLENMLVPFRFVETKEYLFITYTKNYSCPNTAKNGTLKFSRLVYNKKENKIMQIYIDEKAYMPEGYMTWPIPPELNVENDLNVLPFKWPTQVTAEGNPFSILKGKDLLNLKIRDLSISKVGENERVIVIYFN